MWNQVYAAPYKAIFHNGENGVVITGSVNIKENDILGHQYWSNYIRLNSDTHVDHNGLQIFQSSIPVFKNFSNTDAVRTDKF